LTEKELLLELRRLQQEVMNAESWAQASMRVAMATMNAFAAAGRFPAEFRLQVLERALADSKKDGDSAVTQQHLANLLLWARADAEGPKGTGGHN